MDKIDIEKAKRTALRAKDQAKLGAEKAYQLAETTRKSKVVNYLLPSDHQKIRKGDVVVTPVAIEKALQRQRLIQMGIIAPMMIYPLVTSNPSRIFKWSMALAGLMLAYSSYQQYDDTSYTV